MFQVSGFYCVVITRTPKVLVKKGPMQLTRAQKTIMLHNLVFQV